MLVKNDERDSVLPKDKKKGKHYDEVMVRIWNLLATLPFSFLSAISSLSVVITSKASWLPVKEPKNGVAGLNVDGVRDE